MRGFLMTCVLLGFSFSSMAADFEELNTIADAKNLSESVMEKLAQDKPVEAVKMLQSYLLVPEGEFQGMVANLQQQLPLIQNRFGHSLSYEFLGEKDAGKSLRELVYIQKMERHALIWRFIFYKADTRWKLDTFYFDDKVQNLF